MSYWYNNKQTTRFINIDNKNFKPFLETVLTCSRCGNEVAKPLDSWIAKCKRCKTLISFFMPSPIQQVASICEANVIFNIGGVGSGKTTISSSIFSNMLRQIPKARMMCFAQTDQQLKLNAASELIKFFHPSEIKRKTEDVWELKNGSTVEFWPSDNAEKLRSANVNFIWLVEASTEKLKLLYKEATARIRNEKGFIYEKDKNNKIVFETGVDGSTRPKIAKNYNLIIVEANPTYGAWTNNAVLNCHTLIYTPNVKGIEKIKFQAKPIRAFDRFNNQYENSNIVGILNATVDNPLLPSDYFKTLRAQCETEADFNRIVYCDITSQDGLVFENVLKNKNSYFIDRQNINILDPNISFVEGFDPGGSNINNDPEAYLLGVFDKRFNTIHFLDEHKVSGLTIEESCRAIWNIRRKWGWTPSKSMIFVADNALGRNDKRDDRQTLKNDYEIRLGSRITLCNMKSIGDGIKKVNSWLDNKAITFNSWLENLQKELFTYATYIVPEVKKGTNQVVYKKTYSETNNHLVDVLRYIIVILESLGYRQDQHMIDYNIKTQYTQPQDYDFSINRKFDLRRFMPQQSQPIIKNKRKL